MKKWVLFLVILVLVIIVIFLLNPFKNIKNTQMTDSDNEDSSGGASLGVPAPGNEDVEEMIVNEEPTLDSDNENTFRDFNGVCPDPLILETPVDLDLVTSILYPGQMRGGAFNPHGGFRFDTSDNKISVKVPIDSHLVQGSRYIQNGEVQYLFEFISDCGILYRFDHLLVLSPKLEEAANALPEPVKDDSRTTVLDPIEFVLGEEIGTEVGVPGNVFLDFGVYDLRQKNEASETSILIQQSIGDLASYGVCWLDLLPPEDSVIVKQFPGGDQEEGKKSEYCK